MPSYKARCKRTEMMGNRQLGRVERESISYLRKAKALTGQNLARDGFDCNESSPNDQ